MPGLIPQVRSLVLAPAEDLDMALEYVRLCRRAGTSLALQQAHSYLVTLLGTPKPLPATDQLAGCDPRKQPQYALPHEQPRVAYAYTRLLWAEGRRQDAVAQLMHLIDYLGVFAFRGLCIVQCLGYCVQLGRHNLV